MRGMHQLAQTPFENPRSVSGSYDRPKGTHGLEGVVDLGRGANENRAESMRVGLIRVYGVGEGQVILYRHLCFLE